MDKQIFEALCDLKAGARPDQVDALMKIQAHIDKRWVDHPQTIEAKAQWDAVARVLGADGDDVDAVMAAARRASAQRQADVLEEQARMMFESQADKYALPWGQQWEPTKDHWRKAAIAACQRVGQSFQEGVSEWMGQCFLPSLYNNMTERGDRLLEEVLELLQAHGYDRARVPTLVGYVFGRPVGDPAQEVGGVMVTLAGYCWVAGLDMHAAGDAELRRITQPEVMEKIRRKQEAKNALHFDTPLPGSSQVSEQ